MKKDEKIDEFSNLLMNYNVQENDIEHFKINAGKYKLHTNEYFKLKDTHTLNHTGIIYQIWSTLNKGQTENEYICSVRGESNRTIYVF